MWTASALAANSKDRKSSAPTAATQPAGAQKFDKVGQLTKVTVTNPVGYHEGCLLMTVEPRPLDLMPVLFRSSSVVSIVRVGRIAGLRCHRKIAYCTTSKHSMIVSNFARTLLRRGEPLAAICTACRVSVHLIRNICRLHAAARYKARSRSSVRRFSSRTICIPRASSVSNYPQRHGTISSLRKMQAI